MVRSPLSSIGVTSLLTFTIDSSDVAILAAYPCGALNLLCASLFELELSPLIVESFVVLLYYW